MNENKLPEEMRWKEYEVYGDILYWVTQEPFTKNDLKEFKKEFKKSQFKKCVLTTRDFSCYDMINDIRDRAVIILEKNFEETKITCKDKDYEKLMNERNWIYNE